MTGTVKLTPRNWGSFQHYKDRSPPWIKLHRSLADNYDYYILPPPVAKLLPLIWIIASDAPYGILPGPSDLAFRLRISTDECEASIKMLIDRGFIATLDAEQAAQATGRKVTSADVATANGFGPTRHISEKTKQAVRLRDGGKCCSCGSADNIEFNHKIPVSRGGGSDTENIQLLCRSCNRKKRSRLATQDAAPAQPLSEQPRSLEAEREAEAQPKTEPERPAPPSPGDPMKSKARQQKLQLEPPKRPTRLPQDWKLSHRNTDDARAEGLSEKQFCDELKVFRNYWHAASGVKATKMDWDATWHNWCIRFARDKGLTPRPDLKAPQANGLLELTEDEWKLVLRNYAQTSNWKDVYGPPPGSKGCRVPSHLLPDDLE